MQTILINIVALVTGFVIGSVVNMSLIMIGGQVVAPPVGTDVSTMEGLQAALPLFEPRHFLFPFLAHALGTLAGAFVAAMIAASHRMKFAIAVGVCFLLGGIANVVMLPSPLWFSALDLIAAYLPMGWLGGLLAVRLRRSP